VQNSALWYVEVTFGDDHPLRETNRRPSENTIKGDVLFSGDFLPETTCAKCTGKVSFPAADLCQLTEDREVVACEILPLCTVVVHQAENIANDATHEQVLRQRPEIIIFDLCGIPTRVRAL
jgi:hypothetical protein